MNPQPQTLNPKPLENLPAQVKGFAAISNTGDPLGYPSSYATSTVPAHALWHLFVILLEARLGDLHNSPTRPPRCLPTLFGIFL